MYSFDWNGRRFDTLKGKSWKTTKDGMTKLALSDRLMALGDDRLYFITYFDEYAITKLTNAWYDTRGEMDARFVVQTAETR